MLEGKVAIITGSNRGIGRGIASRFALEGANVVINGRDEEAINTTVSSLKESGATCIGVSADVSVKEQVKRLFNETTNTFGTVDILVNNAGLANIRRHFLEMNQELWDRIIACNLKSVYLCSAQAAHIMAKQEQGTIINISSFAAERSHRNMVAYDASKGAIEAATRAMALDLAPLNIRVNAIGPGAIKVASWGEMTEDEIKELEKNTPLGRLGKPEDVAGVAAFLSSDDASYITGQVFYVDGGVLAQLRPPQTDTWAMRYFQQKE